MINIFSEVYRCDCVLNKDTDEKQINFSRGLGYFYMVAQEFEFVPGCKQTGIYFQAGKRYKVTIEELPNE